MIESRKMHAPQCYEVEVGFGRLCHFLRRSSKI